MNNKSQVSLFVIIGAIVIVSIFILVQLNPNYTSNEHNSLSSDLKIFEEFITTCLQRTTQRGIIENLERGGYYKTTSYEYITDNFLVDVPLYLDDDNFMIPSINIFEEELSKFIIDEINICFDDFTSFEEVGYLVSLNGDFSTNVQILENIVLTQSQFPISVSTPLKDNFDIQEFRVEINANIKAIINHMEEFIEVHYEDFSQFPISSLILLSDFEDFLFELDQIDDTIILTFIYNHNSTSSISNSITTPINYNFAINYDFDDSYVSQFSPLTDEELFSAELGWGE